jgi:hypothetical protein
MGRGSNEPVPADFRDDSVVTISYRCTDCEHFTYHFLLYIGAEYKFMEKYGQFPKPRIQLSPALEQGLGDQTKIFRSGYISEQHGFGIGAFAYYRRAVEKLVEELLRQLEELCSDEEKVKYQEALAQTRTELSADKRISLVKNFVPARVCQAGINPLAALYDSLSQDIHNASDEDCLAYAELTRLTISQVIEAIQHHRGTQKTLTENTRKLLDKIASKKKR